MSGEVVIGSAHDARLAPHALRSVILGEVHARPFTPIVMPARVLHFAFDTAQERSQADRVNLSKFCERLGQAAPAGRDKQHRISFDGGALRWEQHSEFTTYTFELPSKASRPFHPAASALATVIAAIPQPGPVLVALDLHLLAADGAPLLDRMFDRNSLAAAENSDGKALFATDFQVDAAGFVRILVLDRGLGPERAGALVQRVVEVETYRTLALLGLPHVQRLSPSIDRIEQRLAQLTEEMRHAAKLVDNHRLLDELTALAAELEAGAAASLFRFGASRAYNEIVQLRLHTIGERKFEDLPTWSSFLARRMAPAMRTCLTTEERQATLSSKLARTANLLRTRVDVEVEQQNRELLKSMNERTRLQLRLQTTVEGLSVAAISYYVVGLFGYLVKAASEAGVLRIEPSYAIAAFVPVALAGIWWIVRRIRRRHIAAAD